MTDKLKISRHLQWKLVFQGRRKNRAGWATCVLVACEREDRKEKKRFEIDRRLVTNVLIVHVASNRET